MLIKFDIHSFIKPVDVARAIYIQSKPVIRDLKGLADFVPYLGYPLLPTLIFSEKNKQFHNVNNNFMNDKDKTPMTMIELST